MAYELFYGNYEDEQARVAHLLRLFEAARAERAPFEGLWEESAAMAWPEWRSSFSMGRVRQPGQNWSQFQVDSSASVAAWRFMSICDAICTPFSMPWSRISCDDGPSGRELKKLHIVKQYYHDVSTVLWKERYRHEANFTSQQQLSWHGLGVFGSQSMFVDELDTRPGSTASGLRYMAQPVGALYYLENHQGQIDGFIRHFRWVARQAHQKWQEKCPPQIKSALERNSLERFDFLHFVMPRTDYDHTKIFAPQGKPWASCYVSMIGRCIVEEGGYRSFPLPTGRYSQADGEVNGRGPGLMALAELKTLNAEKAMYLKQGHRAGDPSYLLPGDDGLFDFQNTPGAYNWGGVTPEGTPLVHMLQTGDIQVSKDMMDESRNIINSAFLVDLFPFVFDMKNGSRPRSARETVEGLNDRAIFLSPLGRQLNEYIGPLVYRELDVLSYLKRLPEQPEVLREAEGEYGLVHTSPLARALQGNAVAGYMRSLEMAQGIAQATGNPSALDHFDTDEAMPDIADYQFAPPQWMSTPKKLSDKRKARAAAVQEENRIKALPGESAIMKAQAISDKAQAGQNTGGTLSGTPVGGMPMMPGQSAPGGRNFGGAM